MKSSVVITLIATLGFLVPYSSDAQSRKKVAVMAFDDSAVQQPTYNVGQRITDQLISALAGNTSFELIDRQNLGQIIHEQNQSYGERFDAAEAIKLSKLANASIVIIGQVNTFSTNKVKQNGVVDLRVTVRVIQVETGEILGAPSVTSEQKAVLSQSSDHSSARHMAWALPLAQALPPSATQILAQSQAMARAHALADAQRYGAPTADDLAELQALAQAQAQADAQLHGVPAPPISAQSTVAKPDGEIQKLVDKAVYDASSQLAVKINAMALSTPVLPAMPKFVGIEDGLVVVNKGHNAGIKVGDKFEVTRNTESSLIDPDTHQPITHKTKQCVLTITVVEDSNASGKCDGPSVPQIGDILTLVQRQ